MKPYCWIVSGCKTPFYGEYAEHDSFVEAKRIGGSATAIALYAAPVSAEPVNARLLDAVGVVLNNLHSYSGSEERVSVHAIYDLRRAYIDAAEQAKPAPELTDERIKEIGIESHQGIKDGVALRFARAIERELRSQKNDVG